MHRDGVVNLSQSTSDSFFEDEGNSSPTLSEDGGRFDFDENLPKRGKDVESRYENLPEVTLSAFDETGRKEEDIKVIKQRRFSGRKPVISSHRANQSCSELTIDSVLGQLNGILGTTYPLDDTMASLLKLLMVKHPDFGTVFAYVRPLWYDDLSSIEEELRNREEEDRRMREKALEGDIIKDNEVPPRRVLDLYSYRVVPWWVAAMLIGLPCAVSHAWMDKKDRESVWTRINGKQWPVFLPLGIDSRLLRNEWLNEGCQYVWVDVFCLRQEGGLREDLRVEEWKLDVPMIGFVYGEPPRLVWNAGPIICYLSGLGRPLSSNVDMTSDRSWFRQAWTLQETSTDCVIAGLTDEETTEQLESLRADIQNAVPPLAGLSVFTTIPPSFVMRVLSDMKKRVSSYPIDRIAGLAYIFQGTQVPAYYKSQTEEEAWLKLWRVSSLECRAQIFFFFPQPGRGEQKWCPTWEQVLSEELPVVECDPTEKWYGRVYYEEEGPGRPFSFKGHCIKDGYVGGLAKGDPSVRMRSGELRITDGSGTTHTFRISANHQYPIPEGFYELWGTSGKGSTFTSFREPRALLKYWVLGHRQGTKFEKFSILQITEEDERQRLIKSGLVQGMNAKGEPRLRTDLC
ncbi:hypothetical protein ARMSODRAFT_1077406 [Armillaria solidipes]|uniref:Heterokaryon incompatibility domain-containing protein n=1 Tax=Armillaria solidipes TaxID=1076256 RepID=A0A2H3C3S4_9AGAR|nr:hypothetical protein ARMSODRAFT_1077406 [Armillaria solidipes]